MVELAIIGGGLFILGLLACVVLWHEQRNTSKRRMTQ